MVGCCVRHVHIARQEGVGETGKNSESSGKSRHPVLKREDRLGKHPFAGFGTVVEDITGSGYTKNQPILLGAF